MSRHLRACILFLCAISLPGRAEDLNDSLFYLARLGFSHSAACALKGGADPNVCLATNDSALSIAAASGATGVARSLIERGADVENRNHDGNGALHIAAASGHTALLNLLLARNAGINQENVETETALMLASRSGHADAMTLLLSAGADAQVENSAGLTALDLAADADNASGVEVLIEYGAWPERTTEGTRCGDERFGYYYDYVWRDGYQVEPSVEVYASVGLIDDGDGADAVAVTSRLVDPICGATPLYYAVRAHSTSAIVTLAEHGADLNLATDLRPSPLLYALRNQDLEMSEVLLQEGAQADYRGPQDETPLTFATDERSLPAVELLLAHRANPNLPNDEGRTPLIIAIEHGDLPILRTLLTHGANANLANAEGNTPLIIAVRVADLDVLRVLLAHGANPNLATDYGMTPLRSALLDQTFAVTKMLLVAGANPNEQDSVGVTPLMIASFWGSIDTVRLLLAHRADPMGRDRTGRTALFYAVAGGGTRELIQQLIAANVSTTATDELGVTARTIAEWVGRDDVTDVLPEPIVPPNVTKESYLDQWYEEVPYLFLRPPVPPAPAPTPAPSPAPTPVPPSPPLSPPSSYGELPVFPWPPPRASAFYEFPNLYFTKENPRQTFGSVAERIEALLGRSGYYEITYYALPGREGFVMLTRVESFFSDGRSKPEPDRWVTGRITLSSPLEIATSLLSVARGQYRLLAFVFTRRPFSPLAGETITLEQAEALRRGGSVTLADLAAEPFTATHRCTVLIYEYHQERDQPAHFAESELDGKTHLERAKILVRTMR